jgi:ribosomal protein L13E
MRAKVFANGHRYYRKGKGFSHGELAKVSMTVADLKASGLLFDRRRKTTHNINCEALKI